MLINNATRNNPCCTIQCNYSQDVCPQSILINTIQITKSYIPAYGSSNSAMKIQHCVGVLSVPSEYISSRLDDQSKDL